MGTIYPRTPLPQKDMTAKTWPHTAPGLLVLIPGISDLGPGHPDHSTMSALDGHPAQEKIRISRDGLTRAHAPA